jgi:hypothetical protein
LDRLVASFVPLLRADLVPPLDVPFRADLVLPDEAPRALLALRLLDEVDRGVLAIAIPPCGREYS